MKTIVYADTLFLVNFLINMILLKITCMFSACRSSWQKLTIASAIGGVYAVCMFFPNIKMLYIFPFKFAISLIMVIIVGQNSDVIKVVKRCAVFYLVSFTFAGVMLALIYFTNFTSSAKPVLSNGIFYFDISLTTLTIASVIAYVLLKLASTVFSRNRVMGFKKLTIYLGERVCEMIALSDTGNLLTDPISNYPVIIADKASLMPLFPSGVPDAEKGSYNGAKLRIIPYSSVGAKNSIMTGFLPDKIVVDGKSKNNVVIGISENTLSATNEYGALLNPNILN